MSPLEALIEAANDVVGDGPEARVAGALAEAFTNGGLLSEAVAAKVAARFCAAVALRDGGESDAEVAAELDEELTTKSDAGERIVPILDGAKGALEELYRTAHDTSDDAPVFATVERKRARDENGRPVGELRPVGRPLSPRMVTRVWRRYAERAGIPETARLHDTRHTAVTRAIEQGVDILVISAIAGHTKTSTTLDVYGHLMPERIQAAAKQMRSVVPAHTFAHTLPTNDDQQDPGEGTAKDGNPSKHGGESA